MKRREFIKQATVATAAVGILPSLQAQTAEPEKKLPDAVAVRNGEPAEMFRKGIEKLGGMKSFVKPGQKVVVKPNIAWDQPPEMAANTHPELVEEIVKQCVAAGASEVIVFDHTCNAWAKCYENSGVKAAAERAGAKVLSADSVSDYVDVERPEAQKMKQAKIFKAVTEADVYINVPVLKHHGGAKMTACMKNYMGIVWDRGWMHRNDLPRSIADAVLYRKPDLNVVDAYRVMTGNGPRGVSKNDVRLSKYQILSRDIVAADVLSARVIGFPVEQMPYIAYGESLGLGVADISKLTIERITV